MISVSRSIVLAVGLLAFPLAGATAQHSSEKDGAAMRSTSQGDTGKSTGPSAATGGDSKMGGASGDTAMKNTGPGYESASAVNGADGRSSGNAATGQSGKKPAPP
jgi:hypothetical protein